MQCKVLHRILLILVFVCLPKGWASSACHERMMTKGANRVLALQVAVEPLVELKKRRQPGHSRDNIVSANALQIDVEKIRDLLLSNDIHFQPKNCSPTWNQSNFSFSSAASHRRNSADCSFVHLQFSTYLGHLAAFQNDYVVYKRALQDWTENCQGELVRSLAWCQRRQEQLDSALYHSLRKLNETIQKTIPDPWWEGEEDTITWWFKAPPVSADSETEVLGKALWPAYPQLSFDLRLSPDGHVRVQTHTGALVRCLSPRGAWLKTNQNGVQVHPFIGGRNADL